ncbi:uncharacterized protein J4E79_007937 [Alternaria viburni]|uniref:uncharacterized protein n=1 Tax=Alternaria viburni TaxID=566460 RepID=UPI0020C20052|nr:uncharacterized protein J4E79_007937 [Alternaria viburni]KAI4656384.1 hypothetical protein J4E79_007937 [Alternaria viburni]
MKHLVRHVEKYSAGTAHPDAEIPSFEQLQDWIINSVQYRRELTNASALVILTHASEIAKDFLVRAKELAEGVQNEDGQLSSLYTLPQELIHAFQKIVIYYLAIERALHENEKTYGLDPRFQDSRKLTNDPYSSRDVEVLRRFGFQARRSLRKARFLFCDMGRPELPLNLRKHLSLGPEYVSLWFMRRLLMKPLEQSKTIGDMYHVYVSKVQFEINHRPSKRLLRAINLIQEELQVLQLVNTWQTNLVRNYLEVIDDSTYEKLSPSRRAMYLYEEALGRACLEHLSLVRLDYVDLMRRCAPLSDRTKQILEINEEDHGKAIMVFTVVTVIFLPLSFVTSYFGMNASDIRDMDETQAVFWSVAIPLTCVTVGSCLLIGYNGDSIRDLLSSMYRKTMRKERDTVEAASITVAQRQGPSKSKGGLDSIIDPFGAAYEVFPSRRRDLYRASYGDDDFDEWYVPDHPMSKSPYLSQPYSSGVPAKGQHSYASPAPLAIEARRQSLYPYPHVPDRRSSRMDYKRSPYMPYKEAAPVRPRPHHIMKGHYANSNDLFNPFSPTSHVDPYADGDLRSRLNIYGHPMSHLPPYPPPRRMSTKDTTTRSRSRYYDDDGDGDDDDDDDEWFERGGRVEVTER